MKEVRIEKQDEKWSEYTLEDGSVIRVKLAIGAIFDSGQFDAEGNPMYTIKGSPVMVVVKAENIN